MKKIVMCLVVLFTAVALMASPASAFLDDNSTNSDSEATAGASVTQNYGDSYNRLGMPISPQMTYPGMPSYFGPATNQPNYMTSGVITMFKKTFSRAEVEALLSSNSGLTRMKARVNVFTGEIPKDERMQDDSIDVRLNKPEGNYAPVGYITIYAKTPERDSVDVFYNALEEAMNTLECEEVLVVGEGAMNVLKSWGAGIGLSYTQAFLKDGNNKGDATGGSGTGGTGISWGEAGYRAKPWLQLILLNNLDTPTRHPVQ
jgi:hypothetical protein